MHKTFFRLKAWVLPMMAFLGFCSQTGTLPAQSSPQAASLSIEAVLCAVQERKQMLAVRYAVLEALNEDAQTRNNALGTNWQGTTATDQNRPKPGLITWPGGLPAYPAENSIHDMREALAALNMALAEYYDSIEPRYLTLPAGQNELQNHGGVTWLAAGSYYQENQLPPIGRFTEANWRENLRLFASNIEQMRVLYWPVMASWAHASAAWQSTQKDANGQTINVDPDDAAVAVSSPGSISASSGSVAGVVSKGTGYSANICYDLPAFEWIFSSWGMAPKSPGKKSGSCASTLNFVSGLKTKASFGQWERVQILAGDIEFFVGAGSAAIPSPSASKVPSLNDGLRKIHPEAWALNRSTKISTVSSTGTDIVLGDLGTGHSDQKNSTAVGAAYGALRQWLKLPAIEITGGGWEKVKIGGDDFLRYKLTPYSLSTDKYQLLTDEGGMRSEVASAHLSCLRRPKFTPLLPAVVKNIGGAGMSAGGVELLPRESEAVRVDVGRGKNDRQQSGWLSSPLDGFGTLEFKGSVEAFELVYETKPASYADQPVPCPTSGQDAKDFCYLHADEFPAQAANAPIPYELRHRSGYLQRWHRSRLRQVKGGDVVADVVYYPTSFKKDIRFYWLAQAGAKAGNFYTFTGQPFKTVTIENTSAPTASGLPAEFKKLTVTENGGVTHVVSRELDDALAYYQEDWTFETTGGSYHRLRSLENTLDYTTHLSHWNDTVEENGVAWHSYQEYEGGLDPAYTDFPILKYSTSDQGSDSRTVTIEWNKEAQADPIPWLPHMYWNPKMLTSNEGAGINPVKIDFDVERYGVVKEETRKLMKKQQVVTHAWSGTNNARHQTTTTLGGAQYAQSQLEYSPDLLTLTSTTAGLDTKMTFGAPGGSMPWVLTQCVGPDGWQQDFEHVFNSAGTNSTVRAGMNAQHQGGSISVTKVNRMGGLISQTVTSVEGVALSAMTGSDFTPWGQPKTITYMDGRKETKTYNDTAVASYGTLASATDVSGQRSTLSDYDVMKRPGAVNTGLDTLTPDYSNPLVSKVTFGAGHVLSTQVNGFGDLQKSSSTQGAGAALDLTGAAPDLTVGDRRVHLTLSDEREITQVDSGLGSRGSRTEVAVEEGLICVTSTALTQDDADHQDRKAYYDANGRLRKRVSKGANGAWLTETWDYPDARTVVYTPGPGPVLKPTTQTLSTDGLTMTTKVGNRETCRKKRSVQKGKLVLEYQINDDSSGQGWTTVSTQTLDPATGEMSSMPWNLKDNTVTQTTTGGATRTVVSEVGTDKTTTTLTNGVTTAVTGKVNGVNFNITSITRDHGRLTGVSGTIAGKQVSFTLDSDGRVSNLKGPGFNKTYVYGGAPGYDVTVTDSVQGTTQTVSSSAVGDLTGVSGDGAQPFTATTTDEAGGGTKTSIDNFGVTIENGADGSVQSKKYDNGALIESREYDAEGLLKTLGTGPVKLTVTYGDDGFSRTIKDETTGSGYLVNETFYNVGLRKKVDGNGEGRSFSFLRGMLASEKHDKGPWKDTVLSYGQDENGRLNSLIVGNRFSVAYGYAGDTSKLNSLSFGGTTVNYEWDASGLRSTMRRGKLGTTWEHDEMGRETAANTGSFLYGSSYNSKNQRITRRASLGSSWTGMTYDSAGRLKTATLEDGTELVYQYDPRGNRLAGGKGATTYTVNALNQLTARNTATDAVGYGVYGTVTPGAHVRVFHPQATDPDGGEDLAVDSHGSYQGWWRMSNAGTGGVTRVEMVVRGTLAGKGSLINGGPQRKDAVTEEVVRTTLPLASESFTYDGAGRLSEDGTWIYGWDAGGHLTGLTRKDGTAADRTVSEETISYRYDCDGRRTGRTHRLTKGLGDAKEVTIKESKVLWDGWQPVCEERTVNGVAQATRWFVWGPDLSGSVGGAGGIGGLVCIREEGGRTLFPVDDGLGNIMAVVDQKTNDVVARYDYGPYGEFLGASGSDVDACPFRYQSKWWDAEAGLSYFGYRYYSPRLGRWLSRDPMGECGGMNLYAYCNGDPVNNYDYLGMAPEMAIYRNGDGELALNLMTRVVDGVPQVRYSDWESWSGPLVGGKRKSWWQPATAMETQRLFRKEADGWQLATENQRIDTFNQQVNETLPVALNNARESLKAFGEVNAKLAVGIVGVYFAVPLAWAGGEALVASAATTGRVLMSAGVNTCRYWHATGSLGLALTRYGEPLMRAGLNTAEFIEAAWTNRPGLGALESTLGRCFARSASGELGAVDDAFVEMGMPKRIEDAFSEIEKAFGKGYADKNKALFNSISFRDTISNDTFGQLTRTSRGMPLFELSQNIGNAKVMALTILHEVRHLRHWNKLNRGGIVFRGQFRDKYTIKQFLEEYDDDLAEIFATSTNRWQGKMLGVSSVDMIDFNKYFMQYRPWLH